MTTSSWITENKFVILNQFEQFSQPEDNDYSCIILFMRFTCKQNEYSLFLVLLQKYTRITKITNLKIKVLSNLKIKEKIILMPVQTFWMSTLGIYICKSLIYVQIQHMFNLLMVVKYVRKELFQGSKSAIFLSFLFSVVPPPILLLRRKSSALLRSTTHPRRTKCRLWRSLQKITYQRLKDSKIQSDHNMWFGSYCKFIASHFLPDLSYRHSLLGSFKGNIMDYIRRGCSQKVIGWDLVGRY